MIPISQLASQGTVSQWKARIEDGTASRISKVLECGRQGVWVIVVVAENGVFFVGWAICACSF